MRKKIELFFIIEWELQATFGRTTVSSSHELDRVQERADKTIAELRRTQAELRVTQVCAALNLSIMILIEA